MRRIPHRRDLYGGLPTGGIAAELGVLDGYNAVDLIRLARPALLHLVDLWVDYPIVHNEGAPADGYWRDGAARAKAEQRLAREIVAGQVELHHSDSVAWLAAQSASSLDWLYLDSDHGEEHVFRELCQALRVVKAGGWICGHDYAAAVPGVVAAVDRFCMLHGLAIDVLTDQPEEPVQWREVFPWLPKHCAFNSFAIRVLK